MNENERIIISEHVTTEASLAKYVTGFSSSLALTIIAYLLVTHHMYTKDILVGILACLAVGQFIVQMIFFLHIGFEPKPRWRLAVMVCMLGVVLIVVIGSIWIMNNLNYRMTPQQMQKYLLYQNGGL